MNGILKQTTDVITLLPSKLRRNKFVASLIFALGLGTVTYLHKPKPLPLTSDGVTLIEDGSWNTHYTNPAEGSGIPASFPYLAMPSDSIIIAGAPVLPDSFFEQKLHIEGQHPIPSSIYGKWLCQLFADSRDIQDKLPSFMEGTSFHSNKEAVCAAAACQFLLRIAGGTVNLTKAAENFFKLPGKTSWTLPDHLQKVGYTSMTIDDPQTFTASSLSPGDIIFARYISSHYLSQTTAKHPGTHTIIYLGYQQFTIPHPCKDTKDTNPIHIIKARRQKQNDVNSNWDDKDIQALLTSGEIRVGVDDNSVITINAPVAIHRLPHQGSLGGTSPRVRLAAQVFKAKKGGSYAFEPTEYAHLDDPSQFFAHPEVVDRDMPIRDIISQIPTVGCLILKDGETLSHHKLEIMEKYSLSEEYRGYMLKYWKIITVRDAVRAHVPIPIALLNDVTKEEIQRIYEQNYPKEAHRSVDLSAIATHLDNFNTINHTLRSTDPSTIAHSGWIMTSIDPGATKSSRCENLRSQIGKFSDDLDYQSYVDIDRDQLSDDMLWDARCHSAQLVTADGTPCDIIIDHPEKIQAGTIYAWHLGVFLRSLHNTLLSLSTIHEATIPSIDQIDPMMRDVIDAVTSDDDTRRIMAAIHIRENNPSSIWDIGNMRKSAKVLRETVSSSISGHNSSGGRWQISYSGFTHSSSIIDAITYIQTLDLYQQCTSSQQEEIEYCLILAQEAVNNTTDKTIKKELSDYLRAHIQTWTSPDDSQMHRYLFEAALVAHNIQQNKDRFISLVNTLDHTTHNQLSDDQQRALDELVCLAHNYGPTDVRQMLVINRLSRIIDQTRISYRTGLGHDLVIHPKDGKEDRQRDNEVYRYYLSQVTDHLDACIRADSKIKHPHITKPLHHIIDALAQSSDEKSLLDPAVQQAIRDLTMTSSILDMDRINLSILPTVAELYDQSEEFTFDPASSDEGAKGSKKTTTSVHQLVISRMTRYLTQTPKHKTTLSVLLWSDGLLALLLLIQMVGMVYKAGRRTYKKIGKGGEMARIE